MNNQEINTRIATDIFELTPAGDGWYADASGFYIPQVDYCNSIQHALDVARPSNISMQPLPDVWRAISVDDSTIANNHEVLATAICMTALAIFDSQQP